jgi:hypothetical protein
MVSRFVHICRIFHMVWGKSPPKGYNCQGNYRSISNLFGQAVRYAEKTGEKQEVRLLARRNHASHD